MIRFDLPRNGQARVGPPGKEGIPRRHLAALGLVASRWALCFPLITTGLTWAPPLNYAALRSFIAGAGLLLLAFALRRPMPQDARSWLTLLGVGLIATSMGFVGMFLAGGLLSPGLATALTNTQPLLAAGLAYFALGERLEGRRRAGLLVGFAGILLIALPSTGTGAAQSASLGVGYVLLGRQGGGGQRPAEEAGGACGSSHGHRMAVPLEESRCCGQRGPSRTPLRSHGAPPTSSSCSS